MFELTKQFRFEAAHTLRRRVDADASRRIHGHSYRAEIALRGYPDPETGMLIDLGLFEQALEAARDALDHRFLDEVADLGPATLENLARWIWQRLVPVAPSGLYRVTVYRDSAGESCAYFGPVQLAGGAAA
ncbi:MAG: 6-carboxytetrahydropterin synthase [Rhodospirillaceae bacterium]|nr:MAG: 6-carboxytetrahydropterin synthase [Rhodospirillaceae bacterium]